MLLLTERNIKIKGIGKRNDSKHDVKYFLKYVQYRVNCPEWMSIIAYERFFEFAHSWIFQYKKGLFWKGFYIHNKVLYLDITILSAVDKIFISLRIVRE